MTLGNFHLAMDVWLNDWSFFLTVSFERNAWPGDWQLGLHILCFNFALDHMNK